MLYSWKFCLSLMWCFLPIIYVGLCYFFQELTTNDFCLPYVYPKTQFLLLKVKDFRVFYPHARGLASLLLRCCPPSLHTLRNFELLSQRSPWKCYPTSIFVAYYPIQSMTSQRAYIRTSKYFLCNFHNNSHWLLTYNWPN